jgi:hypothetical protein
MIDGRCASRGNLQHAAAAFGRTAQCAAEHGLAPWRIEALCGMGLLELHEQGTGQRASHAWLRRGGHRISTLDLFDGQLTVLTGPRGEPWCRAVAEIAANGLPIVGRDLHDEDGAFARHYHLGDAGAVLVRPDGYLVWHRSGLGGDARAALRSAVGLALGRAAEASALLRQAG